MLYRYAQLEWELSEFHDVVQSIKGLDMNPSAGKKKQDRRRANHALRRVIGKFLQHVRFVVKEDWKAKPDSDLSDARKKYDRFAEKIWMMLHETDQPVGLPLRDLHDDQGGGRPLADRQQPQVPRPASTRQLISRTHSLKYRSSSAPSLPGNLRQTHVKIHRPSGRYSIRTTITP